MATYAQSSTYSYAINTTWDFGAFEDFDRSGYLNLGSASDTVSVATSQSATTYVNGQAGDDTITLTGWGKGVVHGGTGRDRLQGGYGDDKLYGDSDMDTIFGGKGNDHLYGGNDTDYLYGEVGNDHLYGGSGNDSLHGGTGADTLMGGADNDYLYGEANNDVLDGGDGDDHLIGGTSGDDLTGGEGADTFHFGGDSAVDYINDFQRGEDKIDFYNDGFYGLHFGENPGYLSNMFSNGRVWVEQHDDGQHVFVDYKDSTLADLEIVVTTTDGALLTASDFEL
jgi:Ca2+-binding RTX toxin-like protein